MRLRASQIAIERGGRRLCSDLSFELKEGEALIVVGANGAGKTSLLRAIAGLLPLAEGSFSCESGDHGASIAEGAHYLGHADALKGALTARENLEFWAAILTTGDGGRTSLEALKRLGLAHVLDLPVRVLSAGQKRRVALARLLVASRPLWLLDEPLTALDEAAQRLVLDILREHLAGGGLVVAATHALIDLAGAKQLRLDRAEAA
jgi:heme exporter protein A